GGNEYLIIYRYIIPLSKPVMATIALFMFLGKWNDWNTSMLYINNRTDLISLQYLLQRILKNLELIQQMESQGLMTAEAMQEELPTETVRMAMAILVAGPALFVFPFFQKYFVKGLTVGSVKG
ncbi:MAG: carbohydrate ABC transporter permease, partial [Clostridia bacterium]|nr:carbohydrate ABC transporter permease [Clostridia bacterium]